MKNSAVMKIRATAILLDLLDLLGRFRFACVVITIRRPTIFCHARGATVEI
jgi:hypothetical protein